MKEKKPTGREKQRLEAEAFLRPIKDGLAPVYGGIENLRDRLREEMAEEPPSRKNIERWINGRVQPTLGMALLMLRVFRAHKRAICKPRSLPYWNRRPKKAASTKNRAVPRKA